jgi:hypothetical protein
MRSADCPEGRNILRTLHPSSVVLLTEEDHVSRLFHVPVLRPVLRNVVSKEERLLTEEHHPVLSLFKLF